MSVAPEYRGFHPLGSHSAKIACAVCGHAGYPGCGWMDAHRRGHKPAKCCGKPLTVLLNGEARTHTRAPIGCQARMTPAHRDRTDHTAATEED